MQTILFQVHKTGKKYFSKWTDFLEEITSVNWFLPLVFFHVEMVKLKRLTVSSTGEEMEQPEFPHTAGGDFK